jgi:secondary thiamine-phosphate synthase enzyme
MLHRINIQTESRVEFQNITSRVESAIAKSNIKNGICHVTTLHTTAGITINENADPDVVTDLILWLDSVAPQLARYRHREGNSPAHIKASIVGSSATIVIENGRLLLGTWQGIFFCEFDGPRNRTVFIRCIADNS